MSSNTDKKPKRKTGLLEALVSLSILVSIAGVTMPIVGSEIMQGRRENALLDMQRIVDGLRSYSHDTLFLPTGDRGRTDVALLYGPGEVPDVNTFAQGGSARPLEDVLLNDSMGGAGWQGPYTTTLEADPWGRAYLLNVDGLIDRRETAWVLSAGPDGIVETAPTAREAAGDDVVLPIN